MRAETVGAFLIIGPIVFKCIALAWLLAQPTPPPKRRRH